MKTKSGKKRLTAAQVTLALMQANVRKAEAILKALGGRIVYPN